MSEEYAPTEEQQDCINKFMTGKSLRVGAYAGTGKTSTLKFLAKTTDKTGLYAAFNKSIATEASREFPKHVKCSTIHSLACGALRGEYDGDKLFGTLNGRVLADRLGLKERDLNRFTTISARGIGYLLGETLKSWQRSGMDHIRERNVPKFGALSTLTPEEEESFRRDLAVQAMSVWEQMKDKKNPLPMGHDGYLKLWAMRRPQLPGDFLFLDEAQDTNGVVLGLVRDQSHQVIAVGDRHQQIYEWRGAINAMTELETELESRLSTSFRFGPEIAGQATRILALLDETLPLKGNPAKQDSVGEIKVRPDAVLFRTNAALIEDLIDRIEFDETPFVMGGTRELMNMVVATEKLKAGRPVEFPLEFFGFQNWQEVVAASEKEEGQDLRQWVKLVTDHGTDTLKAVFSSLPEAPGEHDVTLCTGHKSKGMEWPRVRLSSDFLRNVRTKSQAAAEGKEYSQRHVDSELRLFYVAGTRGKDQLEIPVDLENLVTELENDREVWSES